MSMVKGKNRILVTGGTGFIGSQLIKKLYNDKNEITVFAKESFHPFLEGLKLKRIAGDVRDYDAVSNAVKGCDYVYHLAACSLDSLKEKDEIFSVNISGTENVMKASLESGVKKVVHVSSCSVLGFAKNKRDTLSEESNFPDKDRVYARSKKLGEDKVQEYVKKGLNAAIVIPAYVIGAGEIDAGRFVIFQSISRGRIKFTYPGSIGTVAVEDLADGFILAMEKGKPGQRYILSNMNIELFDFYNLIAKMMSKPRIKLKLPRISYYPMYLLAAVLQRTFKNPPLSTEIIKWAYNYRNYDSSKARKELGWKPKIKLDESLRRAMRYYKEIGVLNSVKID